MKLDNESTVYGIHMVKLILAIFVLIFIVLMLITELPTFIERNIGLTTGWTIGIVLGSYFLFFFYFIMKGSAFVSYNDEGAKIIIRTFKIRPFNSKKISLEIPKNELYKYTVTKQKLKEELHLYIRKGNRISKYPPISIVSLTKDQKQSLLETLEKIAEVN